MTTRQDLIDRHCYLGAHLDVLRREQIEEEATLMRKHRNEQAELEEVLRSIKALIAFEESQP